MLEEEGLGAEYDGWTQGSALTTLHCTLHYILHSILNTLLYTQLYLHLSNPQELEEVPPSGPYLLECIESRSLPVLLIHLLCSLTKRESSQSQVTDSL